MQHRVRQSHLYPQRKLVLIFPQVYTLGKRLKERNHLIYKKQTRFRVKITPCFIPAHIYLPKMPSSISLTSHFYRWRQKSHWWTSIRPTACSKASTTKHTEWRNQVLKTHIYTTRPKSSWQTHIFHLTSIKHSPLLFQIFTGFRFFIFILLH